MFLENKINIQSHLFDLNYTHDFDKLSISIQILKNCVRELTQVGLWKQLILTSRTPFSRKEQEEADEVLETRKDGEQPELRIDLYI